MEEYFLKRRKREKYINFLYQRKSPKEFVTLRIGELQSQHLIKFSWAVVISPERFISALKNSIFNFYTPFSPKFKQLRYGYSSLLNLTSIHSTNKKKNVLYSLVILRSFGWKACILFGYEGMKAKNGKTCIILTNLITPFSFHYTRERLLIVSVRNLSSYITFRLFSLHNGFVVLAVNQFLHVPRHFFSKLNWTNVDKVVPNFLTSMRINKTLQPRQRAYDWLNTTSRALFEHEQ